MNNIVKTLVIFFIIMLGLCAYLFLNKTGSQTTSSFATQEINTHDRTYTLTPLVTPEVESERTKTPKLSDLVPTGIFLKNGKVCFI
jgi:hypothetical protein